MDIIKYYGSDPDKKEFIQHDSEPLMACIAYDGSRAVVSLLDEGFEHHILLAKALDSYDIERRVTQCNTVYTCANPAPMRKRRHAARVRRLRAMKRRS